MNNQQSPSVDAKTFTIGVLAITACVLFVGFLFLSQQPAHALGMNDRGGDYIMLTQQLSTTTEAVVVVDAAAKRLITYAFDYNNKTMEIVRQLPLDQLPKPGDRAPIEPTDRRKRP